MLFRSKRSGTAPDVPTFTEGGLAGFQVNGWNCVVAPRATPARIVARLNAAVMAEFAQADTMERLRKQGIDPAAGTPEQLAAYMKSEMARYAKLMKSVGLSSQ